MSQITASDNKIKPYFIEALGCEGLSIVDIAQSLKTDRKHILQRMRRPSFQNLLRCNNYLVITSTTNLASSEVKVIKHGRPEKLCYLETRAAKALVATYASKEGYRYLDFLFACEQVVLEELPKLLEQIKAYKARIAQLETPVKQKALPGSRKDMLPVPVYGEDMFGGVFVQKWELAHRDSMTEIAQLKSKLRHAMKVITGLTKGTEDLNERIICLEEGKQRRVLRVIKED